MSIVLLVEDPSGTISPLHPMYQEELMFTLQFAQDFSLVFLLAVFSVRNLCSFLSPVNNKLLVSQPII